MNGVFFEISNEDLMLIEGGRDWWGVAAGAFAVIAGACAVAVAPEPVGKFCGGVAICAGVVSILQSW